MSKNINEAASEKKVTTPVNSLKVISKSEKSNYMLYKCGLCGTENEFIKSNVESDRMGYSKCTYCWSTNEKEFFKCVNDSVFKKKLKKNKKININGNTKTIDFHYKDFLIEILDSSHKTNDRKLMDLKKNKEIGDSKIIYVCMQNFDMCSYYYDIETMNNIAAYVFTRDESHLSEISTNNKNYIIGKVKDTQTNYHTNKNSIEKLETVFMKDAKSIRSKLKQILKGKYDGIKRNKDDTIFVILDIFDEYDHLIGDIDEEMVKLNLAISEKKSEKKKSLE